MYGWAFANLIGEIIVGTGLVALPFALIVFRTWHEAKDRGQGFEGVRSLLESVQTRIITALFVMSMCFATTPITSLHNVNMTYVPARSFDGSEPQPVSLKGGTKSGYDTAMADAVNGSFSKAGNLSYVPLWWYSTMAISSGVNGAFRAGLSNAGRDLRMIEDMARMATIEDPGLLYDLQRFYSECFILRAASTWQWTRARFLRPAKPCWPRAAATGRPMWTGSAASSSVPRQASIRTCALTTRCQAGQSILARRRVHPDAGARRYARARLRQPRLGRPTCTQWWESAATGLRDRLINNTSTWRNLTQKVQNTLTFANADEAKDSVARLGFESESNLRLTRQNYG